MVQLKFRPLNMRHNNPNKVSVIWHYQSKTTKQQLTLPARQLIAQKSNRKTWAPKKRTEHASGIADNDQTILIA